ncbi:hypothetical protein A2U01_0091845, partial [Trifolium medium]|nr:hypothetical protein [Trifolium medium]
TTTTEATTVKTRSGELSKLDPANHHRATTFLQKQQQPPYLSPPPPPPPRIRERQRKTLQ